MRVFDGFCDRCRFEDNRPMVTGANAPGVPCPDCQHPLIWLDRWQPEPGKPYELARLQPMRDRLLVYPLAAASKSLGGITLVETSAQRERPQQGVVVSVGPGRTDIEGRRVPMQIQVGDCVFFGKFSGQEFTIDGRKVLDMAEIEVFSRLEARDFQVVEHDNPKDWHLAGDSCDLCEAPDEAAARERLEAARRELLDPSGAALADERARVLQTTPEADK